jgi:hypothetical protein
MSALFQKLAQSQPSTEAPAASRSRAPDDTAPINVKARFSEAQVEKLRRMATARGVSIATILRELVDAAR